MIQQLPADDTQLPRPSVAPGTSALPAEFWQAVLDAWDDPKRHEALLLHCRTSAQLAAAASSYRSVLADPNRTSLAESQLKLIAAAAMAQMEVSRATETPAAKGRLLWPLLLLVAMALGVLLLLQQLSVP